MREAQDSVQDLLEKSFNPVTTELADDLLCGEVKKLFCTTIVVLQARFCFYTLPTFFIVLPKGAKIYV